jgi:hypothetical protein
MTKASEDLAPSSEHLLEEAHKAWDRQQEAEQEFMKHLRDRGLSICEREGKECPPLYDADAPSHAAFLLKKTYDEEPLPEVISLAQDYLKALEDFDEAFQLALSDLAYHHPEAAEPLSRPFTEEDDRRFDAFVQRFAELNSSGAPEEGVHDVLSRYMREAYGVDPFGREKRM